MSLTKAFAVGLSFALILSMTQPTCAREPTPEERQKIASLKEELVQIQQQLEDAQQQDRVYSGGLIKSLIAVRIELLSINKALVEQHIRALEAGAKLTVVVNATKPNPDRAAELAKEIEIQRTKLTEARVEADRYSGGLVKAMAETAVATVNNTLAMLEQQYLISKYGLSFPSIPSTSPPGKAAKDVEPESTEKRGEVPKASTAEKQPSTCLAIDTFDSSVLSSNEVFVELAWKIDVKNTCDQPFAVRATFTIYDKDEFELDSDHEDIVVPAKGVGKARGKMLVSPPDKARRLARQGANISPR